MREEDALTRYTVDLIIPQRSLSKMHMSRGHGSSEKSIRGMILGSCRDIRKNPLLSAKIVLSARQPGNGHDLGAG
jgi:hypothetical protein